MSSFNRVILVGRLTRDPETKYTPQGTQLTKFSIAVNRRKKDEVDFFNVTAWEKLAEICAQWLTKGKLVLIEGEININPYEDKEGKKRFSVDVRATSMQMLGSKSDEQRGGGAYEAQSKPAPAHSPAVDELTIDDFSDDDMPF